MRSGRHRRRVKSCSMPCACQQCQLVVLAWNINTQLTDSTAFNLLRSSRFSASKPSPPPPLSAAAAARRRGPPPSRPQLWLPPVLSSSSF